MISAPVEPYSFDEALLAYQADPTDPAAYERLLERASAEPEAARSFLFREAETTPRTIAVEVPPAAEPGVLEVPTTVTADPHAAPPARPPPATNWGTNIVLCSPQARQPSNTGQVASTLALAAQTGFKARGVGASHSSSIALSCPGILIDSGTLTQPASSATSSMLRQCRELSPPSWYSLAPAARAAHVEVGSGARVEDVLDYLAASNRALPMTGSFTGQTLVGAFMTSTHGAGIIHPPLQSAVRSIQLLTVDEHGSPREMRIERSRGITDPAAYARDMPSVTLIQDDEVFLSVAVSMGCMGFVLSVIIETAPPFFLRQESRRVTWREARSVLLDVGPDGVPTYFKDTYNGGVLVAPYPRFLQFGGDQLAILSRTYLCNAPPPGAQRPGGGPMSSLFIDLSRFIANHLPAFVPLAINMSLETQSMAPVWGPGNQVTGSATPLPRGFSAEHGFRLHDIVPAMDAMLAQMLDLAVRRQKMLVGPISIRYVGAAEEYMSMTHGEPRVFAEVLTLASAGAGAEVLAEIEPTALHHGSRPHWGQWWSPGAVPRIAQSYSQYPRWRAVWKRLDPTGVFHNAFTDKLP